MFFPKKENKIHIYFFCICVMMLSRCLMRNMKEGRRGKKKERKISLEFNLI